MSAMMSLLFGWESLLLYVGVCRYDFSILGLVGTSPKTQSLFYLRVCKYDFFILGLASTSPRTPNFFISGFANTNPESPHSTPKSGSGRDGSMQRVREGLLVSERGSVAIGAGDARPNDAEGFWISARARMH